MKPALSAVLIALVVLFSGCSAGSSHPNRIASITIFPGTATVAKGQTKQFSGTATTNSGQTLTGSDASASWSSSNTSVATIDQNGLAAAVGGGTTTITATVQTGGGAVSGTATLTVTVPTLASVRVGPATATLAAGMPMQFTATGAFNDGSIEDVTASATWTSSASSVASVSSSGLVSTVAPGTANISASLSGLQGSTTLTVASTAPGPIFVNDMSDSRIVIAPQSDQSNLTYFGARDSSGNPTSISAIKRVASDGSWQAISLDHQGRPISITLSDHSEYLLEWTSNTTAVLTAINADGSATGSTNIGTPSAQGNTITGPEDVFANAGLVTNTTAPANALVDVNVTTCGKPESYAQVNVLTPDGNIPALPSVWPLPAGSPVTYEANVASGPLASISTGIQSLPSAFGTFCKFVNNFNNSTPTIPGVASVSLQTAICAGMTAIALSVPATEPMVPVACGVVVTALQQAVIQSCAISGGNSTFDSVATFLEDPFALVVSASVQGVAPVNPQVVTRYVSGGYPTVTLAFPCPSVSAVTVLPPTASVPAGEPVYFTAMALNPAATLIFSSAIGFQWDGSAASGFATMTTSSTSPTATAILTGTGPGGPAPVNVTEMTSDKPGSAQFTVKQTPYKISEFSFPGAVRTVAKAVNDNGDAVGYYDAADSSRHGFLYAGGSFTSFDPPNSDDTQPNGINDSGQIVGDFHTSCLTSPQPCGTHGFIYAGGSFTVLDGADPGCTVMTSSAQTHGLAINNAGEVLGACGMYGPANGPGNFFTYSGESYSATVWNSRIVGLAGIDSQGNVVGTWESSVGIGETFVYSNGTFTQISDGNGDVNYSIAVNSNGQILMMVDNAYLELYSNGSFTMLDFPSGAMYPSSKLTPIGINNNGTIVGYDAVTSSSTNGFIAVPTSVPGK